MACECDFLCNPCSIPVFSDAKIMKARRLPWPFQRSFARILCTLLCSSLPDVQQEPSNMPLIS
jgi:hypothetical protein